MTKEQCNSKLNRELRNALRAYHAESGLSPEKIADKMQITSRACSEPENGEYGFSVFFVIALLSRLSISKCFRLVEKFRAVMEQPQRKAD